MRRAGIFAALLLALASPTTFAEGTDDLQSEATLLLDQGRRLANAGRQAEAVPFYRRGLDYLAAVHGASSAELARHELELGRVLRDADRRDAARALLEGLVRRLRSGGDDALLRQARRDLESLRRPAPPPPPPSRSRAAQQEPLYRVQLMARQSRAEAEREVERLRSRFDGVLRGLPSHLETVDLGARGVWHRVQFGAFASHRAADEICERMERSGWGDCLVTRLD